MNKVTKTLKNNKQYFEEIRGRQGFTRDVATVIQDGKKALDGVCLEIGRMLAESLMVMEQEQVAGTDYHPIQAGLLKWGSQRGSVYAGGHKIHVHHPRLRDARGEVPLRTYQQLKDPRVFSQEMLNRALRGLSGRKYQETVTGLAEGFGISPGSISRRLIEASTHELKRFQERDFGDFSLFALMLDTIHRGGQAFVVALGIDAQGQKKALGLWEGATENHEVAQSLLSDLVHRNLKLTPEVIVVTDGGGGLIRALKDRLGHAFLHQRCVIHKDRNIQQHLPKRYRKEAHRRFHQALGMKHYAQAQQELTHLKTWLGTINTSSVLSLEEAEDALLTLHRLGVPEILKTTLSSTNPIESAFATVRHCEKNIKRYRDSRMSQRWLASVLLYAEQGFRTIKGFRQIPAVRARIKRTMEAPEVVAVAAGEEVLQGVGA